MGLFVTKIIPPTMFDMLSISEIPLATKEAPIAAIKDVTLNFRYPSTLTINNILSKNLSTEFKNEAKLVRDVAFWKNTKTSLHILFIIHQPIKKIKRAFTNKIKLS